MMRSVLNEGTGARRAANGFTPDAAGKTGTTNDLRDAWFVGFTPELLTVVWVGLDDNQPLGLSGAQAALPIWTAFMKNALAGRSGIDVRGAGRRQLRRDRSRHRQDRHADLPARDQRSIPRRHRAARRLRTASHSVAVAYRPVAGSRLPGVPDEHRRRFRRCGYWLDTNPYEPRSLRRAGRGPLPRRRSRARDDRVVERLHAAARRREDARLRRRPHRRHRRRRLLRARRDRQGAARCWRRAKPTTVKYDLNDDFAEETGLVCGGQMEVFIEPIEASPSVYIFGAGHVGLLPGEAGARGRLRRARHRRSRRVRKHRALSRSPRRWSSTTFRSWLAQTQIPSTAYAVIVTRGHRNDLDALRALAPRDLRYIGLIGSRAKVARLYEQLLAEDRTSIRRCSSAFTRRSASTSAPSRRRKLPSASPRS